MFGWERVAILETDIKHLMRQIDDLVRDRDRERLRADRAVDELLRISGKAPVADVPQNIRLADFDGLFEEDEEEVRALKERIVLSEPGAVLAEAAGA